MRIAYVINSVEGGGAASPVPAVSRVMRDLGAEVRVFALTRRDGRALAPMLKAGLDPLVRSGGEHDHPAALRWLAAETTAWGATHLWTSLTRATVLGLLLGSHRRIPVLCWQHNAYLKTGNRLLLRILQSRARLWIADSRCVAGLTHERLKVGSDRLLTWPIFAADPTAPVAAPWQPGETVRIGSLGRLHPAKGYDLLIGALALLRAYGFVSPVPFTVTVAGEGSQRQELEDRARAAGVGLILPGYANQPQSFLAGLHLYLQPSRREGFCIAAHEAMVGGLAVVGSAVGEMAYSIRNGVTGYLVPPEDPAALATRLRGLLSRPEELHRLGAEARRYALEQFSGNNFVAAGTAVFHRLCGEAN